MSIKGKIFFIKLFLIFSILFLPIFVFAGSYDPKPIWGGCVSRVLEDPGNAGTFYAVSNDVFKSTDSGHYWVRKPYPEPVVGVSTTSTLYNGNHRSYSIAINTNSVIIVGDEQWSPLWRSADGGDNWTRVGFTAADQDSFKTCYMVASSKYSANNFFAAVMKQVSSNSSATSTLYESSDAGLTWTSTLLTCTTGQTIIDAFQMPGTGRIVASVLDHALYNTGTQAASGKIYYRENLGTDFTLTSSTSPILQMTWDPINSKIWAITCDYQIVSSTDGINWSYVKNVTPAATMGSAVRSAILFSTGTVPTIYTCVNKDGMAYGLVYKSTDSAGGFPADSWTQIMMPTTNNNGDVYIAGLIQDIVIDSRYPDHSVWGLGVTYGAFYYTVNGSNVAPAFAKQKGIATAPITFGVKKKDTNKILALADNDFLFLSEDNGETWVENHPVAGKGPATSMAFVNFHPTDDNKMYVTGYTSAKYTDDKGLDNYEHVLIDFSTGSYNFGNYNSIRISNLIINPINPLIMYIGYASITGNSTPINCLYKTADGGTSWSAVTGLSVNGITFLMYHPTNPSIIYAGCSDKPGYGAQTFNGNGLYKSTDDGVTWSKIANDGDKIIRISVDEENPDWIVTSYLPSVAHTTTEYTYYSDISFDQGATWQALYCENPGTGTGPAAAASVTRTGGGYCYIISSNVFLSYGGTVYGAQMSSSSVTTTDTLKLVAKYGSSINVMFKGSTYAGTGAGLYNVTFLGDSTSGITTYAGSEITLYNYPNPFNPKTGGTTSIKLSIPNTAEDIKIKIYSLSGDLVSEDTYNNYTGGYSYTFVWDGKNQKGELCAPGVYFVVVDVDGEKVRNKIVLVR